MRKSWITPGFQERVRHVEYSRTVLTASVSFWGNKMQFSFPKNFKWCCVRRAPLLCRRKWLVSTVWSKIKIWNCFDNICHTSRNAWRMVGWIEKVKVKVTLVQALRLCTGRTAHRGSRGIALLFLDHGTRRRWGVSATLPPGKDPVPIVQEAGCAPTPVWTCADNLAPTGIRSRTVQPVASRYTDWATGPTIGWISTQIFR